MPRNASHTRMYLYRVKGMAVNAVSPGTFSMAKYMVQGIVKNEQGLPVEGAAVRIGREIAFSDSSGHFQARFSKRGRFTLTVAPEEFLTNAVYEAVSAPLQVRAELDDAAPEIHVLVRQRAAVR